MQQKKNQDYTAKKCLDKSVILWFRIKFTSTITQLNLGKRSHEKTSVKHRCPCSAQTSHCCGGCSSSHTGTGHFLGRISLTSVPTQQTQETSPGVCPGFSPWLGLFPEFAAFTMTEILKCFYSRVLREPEFCERLDRENGLLL